MNSEKNFTKIVEGRYYLNKMGEIIGPMQYDKHFDGLFFNSVTYNWDGTVQHHPDESNRNLITAIYKPKIEAMPAVKRYKITVTTTIRSVEEIKDYFSGHYGEETVVEEIE